MGLRPQPKDSAPAATRAGWCSVRIPLRSKKEAEASRFLAAVLFATSMPVTLAVVADVINSVLGQVALDAGPKFFILMIVDWMMVLEIVLLAAALLATGYVCLKYAGSRARGAIWWAAWTAGTGLWLVTSNASGAIRISGK